MIKYRCTISELIIRVCNRERERERERERKKERERDPMVYDVLNFIKIVLCFSIPEPWKRDRKHTTS